MKTKNYIQVVKIGTGPEGTIDLISLQICSSDREALDSIQESGEYLFLPVHKIELEEGDDPEKEKFSSRRNRSHGNEEQ